MDDFKKTLVFTDAFIFYGIIFFLGFLFFTLISSWLSSLYFCFLPSLF